MPTFVYTKADGRKLIADSRPGRRTRLNTKFRLSRLVRTVGSEVYVLWEEDRRVGQLHIHYAHDTIHATIILEIDLSVTDEEELIQQIDEDIVSSYLPSFEREDLLVTIFRGEEINSFSYSPDDLDELGPDAD
jgi:hypothetical protein